MLPSLSNAAWPWTCDLSAPVSPVLGFGVAFCTFVQGNISKSLFTLGRASTTDQKIIVLCCAWWTIGFVEVTYRIMGKRMLKKTWTTLWELTHRKPALAWMMMTRQSCIGAAYWVLSSSIRQSFFLGNCFFFYSLLHVETLVASCSLNLKASHLGRIFFMFSAKDQTHGLPLRYISVLELFCVGVCVCVAENNRSWVSFLLHGFLSIELKLH